jgi:hypothetical protein
MPEGVSVLQWRLEASLVNTVGVNNKKSAFMLRFVSNAEFLSAKII